MADSGDRGKIAKVTLKKRAVPAGGAHTAKPSDSPRAAPPAPPAGRPEELDNMFDRSFGDTFESSGEAEPESVEPILISAAADHSASSQCIDIEIDVSLTPPTMDLPPMRSPELPDDEGPTSLRSTQSLRSAASGDSALSDLASDAGIPAVDLDRLAVDLGTLNFLPREVAARHVILPIRVSDDQILLAISDPGQRRVIDEIEFVTGRQVVPLVADQAQLRRFVDSCYQAKATGEKVFRGSKVDPSARPGVIDDAVIRPEGKTTELPGDPFATGGEGGVSSSPIDLEMTPLFPTSPVTPRDGQKKRVLVVDDESDIRGLVVRVLKEAGYDVIEASKGTEALRMVQTTMPDVLVLDAMLPEIHGFDVCRRIKKSEKYRHIPVIMISAIYRGWRFAHDLKTSYGVDHFMEKPFKINDLLEKVSQSLSGAPASAPSQEKSLSDSAQRELEAGIERFRAGDVDGAVERLKRGVDIDPLSHRLHYHLGVLYGKQGNTYLAVHEMESALEIEPSDFATLQSLAQLYEHAGFRFKAVEMWERAICASAEDATRSTIKEHLIKLL